MTGNDTATAIFVLLYLLPALIAWKRRHKNQNPILIINLFLGWTFLGWVGCLAWAFSNDVEAAPTIEGQPEPNEYDRRIAEWARQKEFQGSNVIELRKANHNG